MDEIRIALIGFGYWGPNIARNLNELLGENFVAIFETKPEMQKKANIHFPNVRIKDSLSVENIKGIDAFVVATPIESHYPISSFLLENGKHVLIQKPMAHDSESCEKLIELADKKELSLMVAHTFLFSSAIHRIRKEITTGNLGNLNYISSTRINLGLFQRFHNIVWDLAPHDFSIIRALYAGKPKYISATGSSHTNSNLIDFANISIGYEDKFVATIHLNWLSPIKVRNIIIGGTKKMIVYDDCIQEKIKIYDSGIDLTDDIHRFSYRKGDINIPEIDNKESIFVECLEFLNMVAKNNPVYPDDMIISDGRLGLEVVKMIESCNKSLSLNGEPVEINNFSSKI